MAYRSFGGVVAAFLLVASTAAAQQPPAAIRGTVSDGTTPLSDARVEIFGTKLQVMTGADGRFAFDSLRPGPYWIRVRRLGYVPMTFTISLINDGTRELAVHLEPTPYDLPEIQAVGGMTSRRYADFEWRRRTAWGKFYTRDDIERLRPFDTVELALTGLPFRSRFDLENRNWAAPVLGGWRGGNGISTPVQLRETPGFAQGLCPPAVSVNGVAPWPGNSLLDYPIEEIEAMEVYRGSHHAPIEFQGHGARGCGVVILWLR